jgi:hypothetical protein
LNLHAAQRVTLTTPKLCVVTLRLPPAILSAVALLDPFELGGLRDAERVVVRQIHLAGQDYVPPVPGASEQQGISGIHFATLPQPHQALTRTMAASTLRVTLVARAEVMLRVAVFGEQSVLTVAGWVVESASLPQGPST